MHDDDQTLVEGGRQPLPVGIPPEEPLGELRFVPGALIAGRYRIVSLLGRGGMGEVYRAEDLRIGNAVALKFLAVESGRRAEVLSLFLQEVRLARQVSHPNVCRVFDIGEAEGQTFLSMEYIDGENLQVLLRRIGRLPVDKGLEIAQQLCAGLAAIHDSGVLHRDLKPANVMIDGKGRVRITDFGISALSIDAITAPRAGTPAYMAPEQLAGRRPTVQADLYSLGLVLYELFTGQPVFLGQDLAEMARLKTGRRPVPPSALVRELDARIDVALLQCLEREPAARPRSALGVASMLPGLHPLAAVVAAGETPSPEMVAAAPKVGSLRPAVALACLAGVVLACAGVIALSPEALLIFRTPLELSTEVLADRARAMLHGFGTGGAPAEAHYGFENNLAYFAYLKKLFAGGRAREVQDRIAADRPPSILFWYRQSPIPLISWHLKVTSADPPHQTPGEAYLLLDSQGRLASLEVVPPNHARAAPAASPDWRPLFSAAGLEPARFSPTQPVSTPPVYLDSRAAWTGSLTRPPHAPVPVRIEAGAFHGRPSWFRVIEPWQDAGLPVYSSGTRWGLILYQFSFFFVALAALPLVVRNLRLGRADVRWAWRLSLFTFCAWLLKSALSAAPAFSGGFDFWNHAFELALRKAAMIGIFYLTIEPFLRRYWPERIISWRRLLSGGFRDPLVGRDLLIGCLLGSSMTLLLFAQRAVAGRIMGGSLPDWIHLRFSSVPEFVEGFLNDLMNSLLVSLSALVLFLLLRIAFRRDAPALLVSWALLTSIQVLVVGKPYAVTLPFMALFSALYVLGWARFGLLAGIVQYLTLVMTWEYSMTLDLSAWYAWVGAFALVIILALAGYGYFTSTARRSWLRGGLLDA